jgi:hypothetical protein
VLSWSEIREWVAIAVAFVPLAWLSLEKLVKKSFATTEDTAAIATVLKDAIADLQTQLTEERHKRELLGKDVAGLPDFKAVNQLRETIVNLDRHLAERDGDRRALEVKVQGVGEKLDRLTTTVDRFEQHLLNTSQSR